MSHTVIYLCLNSTDISNTLILVSFFLKPCSHLNLCLNHFLNFNKLKLQDRISSHMDNEDRA